MTDQHTAPHLPHLQMGPKSAVITVTLHDGDTVTASTWSACHGVGTFVADLLGEPSARTILDTSKET